jgi:hypothetical protein
MRYYLLDHPNPYQVQYRAGRRGRLSGGVLLHTTESPKGNGAGPIANWIATQRRDHGSYHCIVDAERAINMAPDDYETWHCAAPGFNQSTWGISIAGRSTDLNPGDDWTRRVFGQIAMQLVAFWQRNGINPAVQGFRPAQQLLTSPGIANHGDAQPWDRSDAFARHPQRPQLEALLLSQIAAIVKPAPPTPKELSSVSIIANDDGTDPKSPPTVWWLTDGIRKRRLQSGAAGKAQAAELVVTGVASNKRNADGSVQVIYAPYILRGAREV